MSNAFRLALLYKYGGVYADLDIVFTQKIGKEFEDFLITELTNYLIRYLKQMAINESDVNWELYDLNSNNQSIFLSNSFFTKTRLNFRPNMGFMGFSKGHPLMWDTISLFAQEYDWSIAWIKNGVDIINRVLN